MALCKNITEVRDLPRAEPSFCELRLYLGIGNGFIQSASVHAAVMYLKPLRTLWIILNQCICSYQKIHYFKEVASL